MPVAERSAEMHYLGIERRVYVRNEEGNEYRRKRQRAHPHPENPSFGEVERVFRVRSKRPHIAVNVNTYLGPQNENAVTG